MESVRRWNSKISDKKIDDMLNLRKEGKAYDRIAELVGVSYETVYKYTRGVGREEAEVRTLKYTTIIGLLEQGKTIREISLETGFSEGYIREIRRTKKYKEYRSINKTKRQLEVEKICKEINRQKEKQKKEWKEQLELEKQYLKERYDFVAGGVRNNI